MAAPATAVPLLLRDPGYLMEAPLLTAAPVMTTAASVFTDPWTGWFSLGATEDGSDFSYSTKVEPIYSAEFFDPLAYATTERAGSLAFVMLNFTLGNWQQALNGGTQSTVSGTGATLSSKLTPPNPGSDVRRMLGWESLDHTVRIVAEQCINGSEIKFSNKKAPAKAGIPVDFRFEIPASGFPFTIYTAGVARAAAMPAGG